MIYDFPQESRRWPANAAAFRRSKEAFGALSNMTRAMPLPAFITKPSSTEFSGSEALYQALKFPDDPTLQRRIATAPDAFAAKRLARNSKGLDVSWWNNNRVWAMRYACTLKLRHPRFRKELAASEDRLIVESSDFDSFWGAKPQPDGTFLGVNALGQVLMELRDLRLPANGAGTKEAAIDVIAEIGDKAPTLRLFDQPLF